MEFRFETDYDHRGLTVMAHALRKTVRRKRSRCSHVFAWCIALLGVVVTVLRQMTGEPWNLQNTLTCGMVLLMLLTMLTEDRLNAFFARKRMLAGTERAVCVFREDGYVSTTAAATTEFHYENVRSVCEIATHFAFFLGKQHGQIFDKASLTGGTVNQFRTFIQEKTGKTIETIK